MSADDGASAGPPEQDSEWRPVWLAGGLGVGVGSVAYYVLIELLPGRVAHPVKLAEWVTWGVATLAVAAISFLYFHPFYERLREAVEGAPGHPAPRRRGVGLSWVMVAIFLFGSLVEHLVHKALEHSPADAWGNLIGGVVYGGVITAAWHWGVRRRASRAWQAGTLAGLITPLVYLPLAARILPLQEPGYLDLGKLITVAGGIIIQSSSVTPPLGGEASSAYREVAHAAGAITFVQWAIIGLVGGFLIDRGPGVRTAFRVAVGTLGGGLVAFGLGWLMGLPLSPLYYGFRLILIAICWGGALFVYAPSDKSFGSESPAPTVKAPRFWLGYLFSALFSIAALPKEITGLSEESAAVGLQLIAFAGWLYWLRCAWALHRRLARATQGAYPIGPWRAVGFHFIPFFNLYWIFRWPAQILRFAGARRLHFLPGLGILIATLVNNSSIPGSPSRSSSAWGCTWAIASRRRRRSLRRASAWSNRFQPPRSQPPPERLARHPSVRPASG